MKTLLAWIQSRDGATAIEYSLIAAGIAIACIAAIFLMGDSLETIFNTMGAAMNSSASKI